MVGAMMALLRTSPRRRTPAFAGKFGLVALFSVVVSVFVAGCGSSGGTAATASVADDPVAAKIQKGRWQAVILTNDRVYFGHLRALGYGWYQLKDVYFIREKQADKGKAAGQQVAPIAEELQQPDDPMVVNGAHIIQVQNLERDSRVAGAIEGLQR